MDWLEFVQWFFPSVATALTLAFAIIWVHRRFMGTVALRISPRRIAADLLVFRVEAENKSQIMLIRKRDAGMFVIHEYEPPKQVGYLSHWVPFEEAGDRGIRPQEKPTVFNTPLHVFETAGVLEPGQNVVVEVMYKCKDKAN